MHEGGASDAAKHSSSPPRRGGGTSSGASTVHRIAFRRLPVSPAILQLPLPLSWSLLAAVIASESFIMTRLQQIPESGDVNVQMDEAPGPWQGRNMLCLSVMVM